MRPSWPRHGPPLRSTGPISRRALAHSPPLLTPCPSPASGRGEPVFPPLATEASNLFQAVVAFVGDGCGMVDDAQYRQRLEICRTCDRRTGKRCTACGCWINVKARGRVFRCPTGHWQ